jgi:hypothetical protein
VAAIIVLVGLCQAYAEIDIVHLILAVAPEYVADTWVCYAQIVEGSVVIELPSMGCSLMPIVGATSTAK